MTTEGAESVVKTIIQNGKKKIEGR